MHSRIRHFNTLLAYKHKSNLNCLSWTCKHSRIIFLFRLKNVEVGIQSCCLVSHVLRLTCWNRNLPYSDQVIRITSKQCLAISRPGHWQTLWWISSWLRSSDFGSELFYHVLAFQIPDLDTGSSSCAEPVTVRGEDKAVNTIGVVQSVQMFAIIQIPEHGLGVLATWGAQRAIGGHGHGVQVSSVADVVGL